MNRSVLIALGIFVVLCLYMLTGLVGCGGGSGEAAAEAPAPRLMTVQVREMSPEMIPREVVLTGKTEPSRTVTLKSETSGRVEMVADRRGQRVRAGDLIARIEMDDRRERLKQAAAAVEQARLEYRAAQRLREQGLRSESEVARALSALRGAEQRHRAIEIDIENTAIRAPFDGILQDRMVEEGDSLLVGDPVAEVIDLEPLVVSGEATEFQIEFLRPGEIGHARLSGGRHADGVIRYVASRSDPMARTFTVELEVPNKGGEIVAGLTARIAVETEQVPAYEISPALISVSDDGRFGIKFVDGENRVRFHEADIVRTDPDALWLTGLPDPLRLITIGQGFTQAGDPVNVEIAEDGWQ